jgi:hypothetical protein
MNAGKSNFVHLGSLRVLNHKKTAEVVGDKDTLFLNSSKVLRHGKVVAAGEQMNDLTDQIKKVCSSIRQMIP